MPKTVLITGASSGIGLATAKLFQQNGWNVAATMRSPDKATNLAVLERVVCLPLDVTQPESVEGAIATALEKFQHIDVLINNAGYGLLGPFEATSPEQIQRQFDTNVFGLMNVTRAVLPHWRDRQSGLLINVSSIGGRLAFPLYSLYHGTKWAVEGFSEALQYELAPFNIRVKLIEPGPIKTDFYDRSADIAHQPGLSAYDQFVERVMPNLRRSGEQGSLPEVTARVIYRAATDGSDRLRYPAGGNAGALLLTRLLPDSLRRWLVRQIMTR
ncbi:MULTISPECIES: SDR family oxidoreductase [unclassified Leptolyngbya]|uniref:SDR family oxidoreductase n=1 Tax=unclassified Leptolyngbya TaxID=2650499 RepID=UPI001683C5F2|nr:MULTISPECIES: SDR family oxidoreductase [unclassified Leptolyngbya]MBD1914216.1 SDR family oxidoreductase [Leptolyngbya sp. FACHB-8]MBD2157223.1 SDR family oxidoreductase [Leptolyngbya sp. FACHB-16]